nr:transposase (putative), gypsy type [Tanacetum cinerariifolium]
CYTKPLDSLKNWNNRFFWVDECVFPTAVDWRTNASKDGMPANGTYSMEAVRALDTYRTPIQKQPEMLLCLFGISRRYYLGDEVPPPEEVPTTAAPGTDQAVETVAVEPPAVREIRKRGHEGIDANTPPKSLRRDHADFRPSGSSRGGKSLAAM